MITSQDIDTKHDNPRIQAARQTLKADLERIEVSFIKEKSAAESRQDMKGLVDAHKDADRKREDAIAVYQSDLQDILKDEARQHKDSQRARIAGDD